MNSFEELLVWQVCRDLKLEIKIKMERLPKFEEYGLRSQILRSSRSVTANIAEGFGRFHYQENVQFCRLSRGSLFETLDHLIEAKDCNYINENEYNDLKQKFDKCLILLNGYIAYLLRKKAESAK